MIIIIFPILVIAGGDDETTINNNYYQNVGGATEDSLINKLQQMSSSTQGRMQGIQVGHMIAIEHVQQLRKLRQLQMSHMQAQNNYLARIEQENNSKKAAADLFFTVPESTQNKKYRGFKGGSK
ncbi:hypothetical protein NOVO_01745 [Rickettsiales bacterium Ac37b]|nr:hypothetical protein NOVO_01745 [Rickettsiales bacterium Ac37b]